MDSVVTRRTAVALFAVALSASPFALAAASEENAPTPAPAPSPAEVRLKADVSFLADDAREGRAPGTPGIEAAAAHIGATFKELGLRPPPGLDGYYQPFKIGGQARIKGTPELAFEAPEGTTIAAEKADFNPLAIGTSATFTNIPVVFAGYGITAKDDAKHLDYDDYDGIDVKGKAVLIVRREPQQDDEKSPFDGRRASDFATFRHKATNAFQHGASAVLLVNDASSTKDGKDPLVTFMQAGPDLNSNLPFVAMSRALADRLLEAAGEPKLADLEAQIDEQLKPRSRLLKGVTATAKFEIERPTIEARNVIGVLEGSGPLADETVIVGAHYDHLGRGGLFSGSLAILSRDIHNGADDNASGTAMMMEMARRLAKRPDPLPRRVVFIAFSGEERGLLGSQHYVDNPVYPLDKTVMMVNFDMVGRLNKENELTVYGTGTTPGIDVLVDALGKSHGLTIKKIADGTGPSDHQSFYLKNLPVLFAFTGTHSDYHRPSDDTERVNFAGMARIADFAELLLLDIARRPERPAFVKVETRSRQGTDTARVAITAYLGSIPDYNEEIKGVKLNGVREGSPAEKGGLKAGDIIIGFGGKPIGTIYDYTESLGKYKPGDEVEVVVKRDAKEVALKVILGTKPSE